MKTSHKVGVGATLLTVTKLASAAVPVAITTAITDAGADAATVATAVIVVLFGIFAIKLMRKGM